MWRALLLAFMLLTMVSCGSPMFQNLFKEQQWSENYALADGVRCNPPEMCDGDVNTVGKLPFPEGVYGRTVYGAFPNAEAEITLPEKKTINKIVIRSDSLKDFSVLASVGKDEWKTIREVSGNKEKEIVIRTSVVTDKIKIRARGRVPMEGPESVRIVGPTGTSRAIVEPEVREVELYGFK